MESPDERVSEGEKEDFPNVLCTTGRIYTTGRRSRGRRSRVFRLIKFGEHRLTPPEEDDTCKKFIIDQLNRISRATKVCLKWLLNPAKKMMAIEIIAADAEGADPKRAAQECRRFICRIHMADCMPGSSYGKPENTHDALQEFFLEELKAVERRTLTEDVTIFRLRDRGLFDVHVKKEEHNSESFTVLHVVEPGYRFIEDGQSPYRIGYDYYVQGQKHTELAEEFRKHLPSLVHLFVEAFPGSTDSRTYWINAYFADGSSAEAFETLAARFLAAFFRILEEKS